MKRHCSEIAAPINLNRNARWSPSFAARFLALAAASALPGTLWAQSCALCYQAAASSGARFIAALRSGIMILIVAPVVICTGVAIAAYRKRDLCVDDELRQGQ